MIRDAIKNCRDHRLRTAQTFAYSNLPGIICLDTVSSCSKDFAHLGGNNFLPQKSDGRISRNRKQPKQEIVTVFVRRN